MARTFGHISRNNTKLNFLVKWEAKYRRRRNDKKLLEAFKKDPEKDYAWQLSKKEAGDSWNWD